MKHLKLLTAITLILIITAVSAFTVFSAENYVVLQGFAFDVNSDGEAVIHSYDDRSADVVIPQRLMGADVVCIDDYAFFADEAITSVSFDSAEKLKKIGVNAFYGCKGLKNISLPLWITELSFGSFQNCSGLEELTLGGGITEIPAQCFYGCAELNQVAIPKSVTTIGDRAFVGCSKLNAVEIPETVEQIAANAFDGCPNVVIYCTKESYARTFAAENGLAYVVTDADMFTLGDADGDGDININDVTAIQRHLAQMESIEGACLKAADTNQDGILNISDATDLQMYLAEFDVLTQIGEVIIQ